MLRQAQHIAVGEGPGVRGPIHSLGLFFFPFLVLAQCHSAETPAVSRSKLAPPPIWAKTWHTEPSPLLLQELQNMAARIGTRGGNLALSIYSTRYQRHEVRSNDTGFFVPASCLKMVVTAAALDTFPVNFYPTTVLEARGELRGHSLRGSLRVIGGGDPNISDRFFPDALSPLLLWADSLHGNGIDTVVGPIEVVDSFFTGPRKPAAWQRHHFDTWYGAEISALSFNDNAFALTVSAADTVNRASVARITPEVGFVRVINQSRTVAGKKSRIRVSLHPDSNIVTLTGRMGLEAAPRSFMLPVRNPPRYFLAALRVAMKTRGIVLQETTSTAPTLPLLKSFRFTTASLTALVEETNQRSQNLHAELLLRHLGKRVKGEGSTEAGLAAEKEFLIRLGLDTADFILRDACGLSHEDRVKPAALTALLARMVRHRFGADYVSSLALPGLDGVTGRRLRTLADENMVRYKTGSISRAQGLVGYVFASDGDTLAVTTLINGFSGSPEKSAALLDSLFSHIAYWYNKERPAQATAYKLLNRPDAPRGYRERLRYFSHALEGTPYFLGPTGEGRFGAIEPLPMVDLSRFDCVTYLESIIGLSLARNAADLLPAILSIRYRGDTVSYATRNHFFTADWLGNNPGWFRIFRTPGDTVIRKTLYKKKLLASKGLPQPALDPELDIAFLPYEKALLLAGDWDLGSRFLGVAFATNKEGLDVTHTGIVEGFSDGKHSKLRHAGQLKGMVVEQDFKEYLESRRGKCAGVVFFEFLSPGG